MPLDIGPKSYVKHLMKNVSQSASVTMHLIVDGDNLLHCPIAPCNIPLIWQEWSALSTKCVHDRCLYTCIQCTIH